MNTVKRMLICLFSFWLVAGNLMASPADDGRKAFESGDYKKAYKLLSKAAKKTKDNLEKADLYVMAGAAAAKVGKKKKAKSRFGKALKLNPDVSLPAEVAGDAKVKKAFASAQKKFNKSSLASSGGSGRSGDSLRSTASASRANKSPNNLTNYLPFGINSFLQGKTITGAVYGGGQVLGILLFLNRQQAASDADKDAEQVIAQAQADGETENPEFLQFIDDNEAFVNKSRSEATLALGIFAASYALSIVDCLFDPFGTATASLDSDKTYARLGGKQDSGWKFDLNVLPTEKPMVFLDMKQNF